MEKRFWLVWSDLNPSNNPTYRHSTCELAELESRRLAANHPGHKFYVLSAVGYAEKQGVSYTDLYEQDQEEPF
jgi:hypothetical protein